MVDLTQNMRYSQDELSLLKKTFENDEQLLYVIRKHLLQLHMTETEEIQLRKINKGTVAVLRKNFIPEISDEVPLMQTANIFIFKEILTLAPEDAYLHIGAKMIVEDYYNQQFAFLEGKESKVSITLDKLKPIKDQKIAERIENQLAWNFIVSNIDVRLDEIRTLSRLKAETEEEKKKRLAKNSNK